MLRINIKNVPFIAIALLLHGSMNFQFLRATNLYLHRIFERLVYLSARSFSVNSVFMNTSGDRLRNLLRECHLSASDFAANRRVTPQHVNNWFKRGIPMARLDEIAELLCVNSRWLRSGEGPKHPGADVLHAMTHSKAVNHPPPPTACLSSDITTLDIAFYSEVLNPDGSGKTHVAEIPASQVRLTYEILLAMDVSSEHAICAPMIGNSMAHRIQSGSTVAIDRSLTHIIDGEIYALEHDGMLRIRYLYRLPNDGLRVRCHNHTEYPDQILSAQQIQEQGVRILGWVFWWSTLNTRRPTLPGKPEE